MYNFYIQALSLFKALYSWNNRWGYISSIFITPVLNVLMYAVLGRFAAGNQIACDLAIGTSAYMMFFMLTSGINQCMVNDRRNYTISYLYISPANRGLNYLSRAVYVFPLGLLAIIFSILTIRFVTDIDFGQANWPGLILAVFALNAALCGFGLFLGSITVILRSYIIAWMISLSIVSAFTGVIIPLSAFPAGLQEVFRFLPLTNGLDAIRSAFAGAPLADIWWPVLRELINGVMYLGIGAVIFTVFERIVKKSGALEMETQS
jgi:ABC-2 type transport system permease protein